MNFKDKLDNTKIPNHVAIIMDGNGRWAKQRGGTRILGHRKGADTVNDVVEAAAEIGVKFLTVYAFSTENWTRPKQEIDGLMQLLIKTIETKLKKLLDNNIKLKTIGDVSSLPNQVQTKLLQAIERTKDNSGMTLILALSYSSKWEITNAMKEIVKKITTGEIKEESLNCETINKYLSTFDIPDPELLIRTSGEMRISNFLLWQIAYSELYFTPILWPDFTKENFYEAIVDYQQRERRFGKTSEQLKNIKTN